MAFVLGNTIIGYSVGYLFAVGGNTQTAYTSHCPQGFGGETAIFDGDFLLTYNGFVALSFLLTSVQEEASISAAAMMVALDLFISKNCF